MPSSSKRKGNNFERELVRLAQSHGLEAERAYASNGKALGQSEECDLMIYAWTVQAKKRESYGDWLWNGLKDVDVFVIGKNRREPLAILPYEKLLELLK